MKERLLILLSLSIACLLPACNKKVIVETKVKSVTDPTFGNIDFELDQQQLESKGINYDDLLKFTIHNPDGEDTIFEAAFVKNYNEVGYFAPCLCNYTGKQDRPEISFGIMKEKNNPDILVGRDVTIEVLEKGGYAKTRSLVDVANKLTYEELGDDNLAYANFRDVTAVGTIASYIPSRRIFRGSSPFNYKSNPDGRNLIADAYLKVYDIESEISLANSDIEIQNFMDELKIERPDSPTYNYYYDSMNQELPYKTFFAVNIGSDYYDISTPGRNGSLVRDVIHYIAERVTKTGYESMPFYFHCNEGKDRTGFFAMILEALCGVPLNDIVSDAMLTFKNYYNVSKVNNREKYDCLSELLIYRHIYSILIKDPVRELGEINWYEFDAKKAVEEIIAKKPSALRDGVLYYLNSILKVNPEDTRAVLSWLGQIN